MHDALWRSFFSCARVLNRSLSIGYTWERGHCTFPFFFPPNNHLAERKTKCLRWYPPPLLLIGKKMRRRHCPPHVTRDHATRGNEVQNTPEKKLTPSEKTHIFSRTANAKKKKLPRPLGVCFFYIILFTWEHCLRDLPRVQRTFRVSGRKGVPGSKKSFFYLFFNTYPTFTPRPFSFA